MCDDEAKLPMINGHAEVWLVSIDEPSMISSSTGVAASHADRTISIDNSRLKGTNSFYLIIERFKFHSKYKR